jgi:hypothetical protein
LDNESHRKAWNKNETVFRDLLMSGSEHAGAIRLFHSQHAALHSARMAESELWSFEDWVLDDLSEAQFRRSPPGEPHSVAWLVWHLARIEDVAVNVLVAGGTQVFVQDDWLTQLKIIFQDTGNAMPSEDVAALSASIDLEALRRYRTSVGRRTRQIVQDLRPEDLKRKVDPVRLQRVLDEGAVVPAATGLIEYWGNRDIAGLLLMPPTRHNFVHLNEALRIKKLVS